VITFLLFALVVASATASQESGGLSRTNRTV